MTCGSARTRSLGPSRHFLAVVHHHDVIGEPHDDAHIVLDQQHRDAERRDAQHQLGQLLGLGVVQARGGLVHQQQARLQRQRARDLHQALMAEGQAPRPHRLRARQGRRSGGRSRAAPARLRLLASRPAASRGAMATMPLCARRCPPHMTFSSTRHVVEQLQRSGTCAPCRARRCRAAAARRSRGRRSGSTLQQRQVTADEVEHGRLAGAVRADQRGDRACLHGEAHAVHGAQAAETAGDVSGFQQRAGIGAGA